MVYCPDCVNFGSECTVVDPEDYSAPCPAYHSHDEWDEEVPSCDEEDPRLG